MYEDYDNDGQQTYCDRKNLLELSNQVSQKQYIYIYHFEATHKVMLLCTTNQNQIEK